MNKTASLQFVDGVILVSGDLHFGNVMNLLNQSVSCFPNSKDILVDFSRVTSSDSAGLALIIEWLKMADRHNATIQFKQLSSHLMSIAVAAGVDALIKA